MTDQTTNSLLPKPSTYVNPRYAADATKLAAHDKAIVDAAATANPDTAPVVQPNHDWEKRYKDLQSFNSRKINELSGTIKTLQAQGVQKIAAPSTPEEMEAFKTANSETYAVIETMAQNIAKEHMATYDAKLNQVSGDLMETQIERASLALKAAHPDYEEIANSEAFQKWAASQSEEVQDWIYNNPNEPAKAIRALSLYKYEAGLAPKTESNNALTPGNDVAVAIPNQVALPNETDRNHPSYMWKESEIAKMNPKMFSDWMEHITLAQREGRILIGQ